jgi:hypothetical protein
MIKPRKYGPPATYEDLREVPDNQVAEIAPRQDALVRGRTRFSSTC